MMDPRLQKLAENLINYSCRLQKGEKLLIEAIDIPKEMVIALIRAARKAGGLPLVTLKNNTIARELYRDTSADHMQACAAHELARMQEMDAYLGVRGSDNITELSDVPSEMMKHYQQHWLKPVHLEVRVPKTKWCVLRWPHPSMAQAALMPTEAFEDFYFDVCTMNYANMSKAMDPLKALMDRTDKVRILGPETDLRFSIKGINAIKCDGQLNIPDGECFSAPVKDSVEGHIYYNAETLYHGTVFSDIRLEFKAGKIVKATGSDTEKINEILDSDEGARYVGEFALGFNPYIDQPMKDILFDEKIKGSFHFTPGNAYEDADNGNKSEVHWDMVSIQTPELGGGEIWFDDVLIRKDGLFVLPELEGLNPDNLK